MKSLLLVNPPQNRTIEGNLPKYVDQGRGHIPPLGLLYTAAAVEQKGKWQVRICDMSAGELLGGDKPDVVGITATTFTLIDVLDTAKKVKEIWGVPVVLGGIHPTIYPQETADLPNVDCVFTGESEATFPDMLDHIAIKGAKVINGKQPDIERLPMPAYHLLDKRRYYSVIGTNGYSTSMFTSRGCPYKCIFCHRETMGKTFRARTAEQVIYEMKNIASMGIREILIYDDTFTVNRQRVRDICKNIIQGKVTGWMPDIHFDIRARVDHMDGELLGLLKSAGCKRIHYGVEAGNDRVLEVLKKGITIDRVRRVFKLTKSMGIETLAYFIIGSPTETNEDILGTIALAKELKPDYCHFGIMTPYPATPLYQMGLDRGLYDDYWREFAREPRANWQAPYWNELTRDSLKDLLGKAYREFYWRPGQIAREAIKTRSAKQLLGKGSSALRMAIRR